MNIGLFGGGYTGSSNNTIDHISTNNTGNAVDFGDLTYGRYGLAACSSSIKGIFGGGWSTGASDILDYVMFTTTGNAVDFGDLTYGRYLPCACSNTIRGLFAGGYNAGEKTDIFYITLATNGNAVDFGDLGTKKYAMASCASPTKGLFSGGLIDSGPTQYDIIDYVTIATTGNAIDFGDLTVARSNLAACASPTRGLFAGGTTGSDSNVIDYVTIATTGNAIDFGDLTLARYGVTAIAGLNFGIFGGGYTGISSNVIDYVTIATLGNAIDFGDLTVDRAWTGGCSDTPAGLYTIFSDTLNFVGKNIFTSGTDIADITSKWDWGDLSTSIGSSQNHQYLNKGKYDVNYNLYEGSALIYTLSAGQVTINNCPNIKTQNALVPATNIHFYDGTSGDYYVNTIDQLIIDYGDGSSIETGNISSTFIHSYASESTYTVNISAIDLSGNVCVDTTPAKVTSAGESVLKLDYINIAGAMNPIRYGGSRQINLTGFLPDTLLDTECFDFVKMFEDFLNEMYDGTTGYTITTSSDTESFSGVDIETISNTVPTYTSTSAQKISILEKIYRLTETHDPDLIDLEYIQFFAKNLGYNIDVNRAEIGLSEFDGVSSAANSERYLRFMVRELPNWYKIKTTRNAIKTMLFSFGMVGDILNYYTNDYENNWKYADIRYNNYLGKLVENLDKIPDDYYPTPHFALWFDINASETNFSFRENTQDSVIRAINAIKPLNTVFEGIHGYFKSIISANITPMVRYRKIIKMISDDYSNPDFTYIP